MPDIYSNTASTKFWNPLGTRSNFVVPKTVIIKLAEVLPINKIPTHIPINIEKKLSFPNNIILKFLAMLFGVAILEEALKQVFVYVTIIRDKKVILPRTTILYGMIAGLSFGIFEGIEYQMNLRFLRISILRWLTQKISLMRVLWTYSPMFA